MLQHFAAHPPQDFSLVTLPSGIPGFALHFDLRTTMSPGMQQQLAKLPLGKWVRPYTCFVGTTCTEYAIFPRQPDAQTLVSQMLQQTAPDFAFFIIKDLPTAATLVGEEAFAYTQQVCAACARADMLMVEGQALAYVPIDFQSIEAFLGRMPRSRRKDIKRKLKSDAQLQVSVLPTGDSWFEDSTNLQTLYTLYLNVYQQSEIHFDLLTPEFFRDILLDRHLGGAVFLYRAGEALIGFNLCLVHQGMLIDKYIGLSYPAAREHNLYVVSWFRNLQYALEQGLHTYVAGWTDPEIKRHLGAHFTFTQHAVYIRNPLVRALLKPLRRFFESDRNWHETAHS